MSVAEHHRVGRPGGFDAAAGEVLSALGPGEVVTYGEVAAEAGYPGAARAVGRLLARGDGEHPWWRVVTATGRLVPGQEEEQTRRLRVEGIEVTGGRVQRLPARADG